MNYFLNVTYEYEANDEHDANQIVEGLIKLDKGKNTINIPLKVIETQISIFEVGQIPPKNVLKKDRLNNELARKSKSRK